MQSGSPQAVLYCWLGAAACAGLALWSLYRFLRCLRRDRLVADTPLVKIRSAAQGYVKLSGRAACENDTPLRAPLSSRPCVWWRYEVEQKVRNSKNETRWESIDSGSSVDLFLLRNPDAECLVGPVRAEITPTTRNVWYGSTPRPQGPPPASPGFLAGGDFRYTESLLSVGDTLSVLGELRSHSTVSNSGAAAADLLKQWKQDQSTLLARFDKNHDGRIDAEEWEAARQAAAAEAPSRAMQTPVTRMSVISQPVNGEPFLIAAMDDEQLVRREKWHAVFYFGLGLAAVIACAWAIEHTRAPGAAMSSPNAKAYGDLVRFALFVIGPGVAAFVIQLVKRARQP